MVSTPGVFSLFSKLKEKCLVRKLCLEEQHPPWSYPILFVLCYYWTTLIWHLCEWKIICNCWFTGQGLSSSEDDDIAWNQKPKENQAKKKKGKNSIDSGNVLGWTLTVSKGTDFEALLKLLHLLVVMLYSVLVNSQCNLHHYENIMLKDSNNDMYNIKTITWPYIWSNLTSLLDSDEDPFPPKIRHVICFLNLVPFYTVVVKLFDPNISPESRVKEIITNYRNSWLLNKFSLSAA